MFKKIYCNEIHESIQAKNQGELIITKKFLLFQSLSPENEAAADILVFCHYNIWMNLFLYWISKRLKLN